ncbi:MAG: hypothetical protein KatS3mg081_1503 [Gemmatimonadales bacterium]|nr:MAG: hypothetical protein KatS3mg081_1503 [Gemmatimonadales bacterium]
MTAAVGLPLGTGSQGKERRGSVRRTAGARTGALAVLVLFHTGSLPAQTLNEWKTDFSKRSVPLEEIVPGGPPKDGIPAIDRPKFVSVQQADRWLDDREPVVVVDLGGEAKAYPLQILIWHEIVNDAVGGVPVAVTYCPLCNTALVFDRRVADRILDFGTTGRLRHSDLVMYDRQTESWWQQATGEAIVGTYTGSKLRFLSALVVSWKTFKSTYQSGKVLSRQTGHSRPYGKNPYAGYDNPRGGPISGFFSLEPDRRLPAMERVVALELNGESVAYPFSSLEKKGVVNDQVGGLPVVVFWMPGTASAVDAERIAGGRDVGSSAVYGREIDGRRLTFETGPSPGLFLDRETGSRWTFLGEAISGPLAGKKLNPLHHGNHFWFAWAAFQPSTRIAR